MLAILLAAACPSNSRSFYKKLPQFTKASAKMSSSSSPTNNPFYADERAELAAKIQANGIRDLRVLSAMSKVPRHKFVPYFLEPRAYEDTPFPIGHGQTISQPYIVALMAEMGQIGEDDKVLEVGAGCGYSAAVLSLLGKEVVTTEIIPELGNPTKIRLLSLGYENVKVVVTDGSVGYKEAAPFDAIIVTAAAPSVPMVLVEQLAPQGRLVLPVADESSGVEQLVRITRTDDGTGSQPAFSEEKMDYVRFVPLRGEHGYS